MALGIRRWLNAAPFVAVLAAGSGCTPTGSSVVHEENRKMDALSRCGEELARGPAYVARSQAPGRNDPEVLPPVRLGAPGRSTVDPDTPPKTTPTDPVNIQAPGIVAPPIVAPPPTKDQPVIRPVANTTSATPATTTTRPAPDGEGDTQVRIVASIGNSPIYESEVREAVYQRLGEFVRGGKSDVEKEKAIFREELRRLIERELVLDEMTATLTARKQTVGLTKLREAAVKEADQRIKEFKKERGVGTDEEFKAILRIQGLTLSGIRRQIERGFMMQAYLQEKFSDKMKWISLESIREYYDSHPNDYKADDSVKWQDLFVLTEKFPSADAAKLYAQTLANRAAKGEDFVKLAKEFSQGDSASRDGAGIGEKRGEIFPPELEPTIFAMKQGQIQIVQSGAGFHIIRIAERTYAGRRPFDEKLQADIRRKVQNQIYDREVKRLVETLWKRVQPQIWID